MSADNNETKCCANISVAFANLILRLWVGLRLFMAGVEKFRSGAGYEKATFNLENYKTNTGRIAKLMADNSIIPEKLCNIYANSIGYVLLAVGAWVLVGLFVEAGLVAAGLVFLSLGVGLAALPDDTEVTANIGLSVLIVAAALVTAKSKKLSLDGLFFRKRND